MSVSPQGVWLRIRPVLGRIRRTLRPVAERARVSGTPSDRPVHPVGRAIGFVSFGAGAVAQKLAWFGVATRCYRRSVDADPRFATRFHLLGNVRRYAGDIDGAIDAYQRALEVADTHHGSHFWLAVSTNQPSDVTAGPAGRGRSARTRFNTQMVDRALAVARDTPELGPRDVFWLGVAEHHRGRVESAEALCRRAVDLDPTQATWLRQLGLIRRELHDWRGSVEAFEAAVEVDRRHASDTEVRSDAIGAPDDEDDEEEATLPPASVDETADDDFIDGATSLDAAGDAQADLRLPTHGALRETAEAMAAAIEAFDDESWMRPAASDGDRLENWAAVAALHRSALDRTPDDAVRRYWLGVALQQLGDWAGALDAIMRAVEEAPPAALWFDRLTAVASRAGRWDVAAGANARALAMEPTGHRYFQAAVVSQRAGRWEESSAAFQRAVELEGLLPNWVQRLGAARRDTADWAGTAALYRSAVARTDDARYHFGLGFALSKLGDWEGAIASYEAAIFRSRGRAEWHYRLGLAHERFGSPGVRVEGRVGLVRAEFSNLPAAAACFRRAIELAPDEARYWLRLGDVEERLGNLESACEAFERATELEPDNAHHWYRRGRAVAAVGNRRGVYRHAEYDELERLWGRAIEVAPSHSGSRQQLTRSSVKAGRWELASRTAWYPPPPAGPSELFGALRGYLENPPSDERRGLLAEALSRPTGELRNVPIEWWFPLHWRLLDDGQFTLGFRAKEVMAESIAATAIRHPSDNPARFLEIGRALTFLDRPDEAIAHLDTGRFGDLDRHTALAMRKMAADVELLNGHVEPYAALLPLHDGTNLPEAEDAFRRMVEGRTIAIVGPAMSNVDHGDEIDGFDVVVRTKYVSSAMAGHERSAGSRTDLSYYALGSARFLAADIFDALATGQLKMALFRTATYDRANTYLHHPGDLRYLPSEYQGGLRSGQFAIQRIVYDLLRYRPARIKIFNINFFLAEQLYRPGYLADYVQQYEAQGLAQVLGAFGHDFRADFVFTQRLHRHGLIEVDEHVASLLQLTPEEYLRSLDSTKRSKEPPANRAADEQAV